MTVKTRIIAEVGINHNGDIDIARKLIEIASNAGVDCVKFQTFKVESLSTRSAPRAKYQKSFNYEVNNQQELLRPLEMSDFMHRELRDECLKKGVDFLSTAFDIESIDYLVSIGQSEFKIPSGEVTNLPYLRHIGSFNFPTIISTGMCTLSEVEEAIGHLELSGLSRNKMTLLHCTSSYPCAMDDVNLLAMKKMEEVFGTAVGYSDHTLGVDIPLAAVALGASVIEKHITLDRALPGPDHGASIVPDELVRMVEGIRNIEYALGDGIKAPRESELDTIRVARKSLVATKPIRIGDIFSVENISCKRPGTGVSPMKIDEFLGRVSYREYSVDDFIEHQK